MTNQIGSENEQTDTNNNMEVKNEKLDSSKLNKNSSPNESDNSSENGLVDSNHVSLIINGSNNESNNENLTKMLWNPLETTNNVNQSAKLIQFESFIEKKFNLKFESFNDFYKWSVENYLQFWEEFWHFSGLIYSKPYTQVFNKPDLPMDSFPLKWFDGSLLNYAENLLRYDDDRVAIYSTGEAFSQIKSITFKQLRERVQLYQKNLKRIGVKKGDRVVGYLPNVIECVEAKLAVISLGAIWSCTSPDFGSKSVLDRFNQIKPKVIFSVTSVIYNGKKHDHVQKLNEVLNGIDSIENVIIVPFCDESKPEEIANIPKSVLLNDFLNNESSNQDLNSNELTFEQVPFDHPLVILFSSGTTGTPKCIVHSHGGTLIQHLKEHILHGNMTRDDIIIYYTTTGWMMYNWLLTSLAVGATIVLFDGSPMLPTPEILWNLVDQLGITMFGTSAKYLAIIEEKLVPRVTHKLDSLKVIYSTGSPLKPSSFDYVYSSIKKDVVLSSITGGTDIISLFGAHNIHLPVYRGEIQCRGLGMAVECWNEDGKPVYDVCGELVCTKPFPSMPIYFYDDLEFKKYKSSYFERFPGVWAHGDFCVIDSVTGGITMLGRSDGTLNPNGVRFGSAEIYNLIETFEQIEDSLCVGQKNPNITEEERVVLFLKMKKNYEFNQNLLNEIKTKIRVNLSARHVPSIILPIEEIPYTLNGKKVEVPVRRIIEGVNISPSSSLVNPKCLDQFKDIPELKKW